MGDFGSGLTFTWDFLGELCGARLDLYEDLCEESFLDEYALLCTSNGFW